MLWLYMIVVVWSFYLYNVCHRKANKHQQTMNNTAIAEDIRLNAFNAFKVTAISEFVCFALFFVSMIGFWKELLTILEN